MGVAVWTLVYDRLLCVGIVNYPNRYVCGCCEQPTQSPGILVYMWMLLCELLFYDRLLLRHRKLPMDCMLDLLCATSRVQIYCVYMRGLLCGLFFTTGCIPWIGNCKNRGIVNYLKKYLVCCAHP